MHQKVIILLELKLYMHTRIIWKAFSHMVHPKKYISNAFITILMTRIIILLACHLQFYLILITKIKRIFDDENKVYVCFADFYMQSSSAMDFPRITTQGVLPELENVTGSEKLNFRSNLKQTQKQFASLERTISLKRILRT